MLLCFRLIWGLLIFYFKKSFKSKNFPVGEEFIKKIIYSNITDFLSFDDYNKGGTIYLISKEQEIFTTDIEHERDEIKDLLKKLEKDSKITGLLLLKQIKEKFSVAPQEQID